MSSSAPPAGGYQRRFFWFAAIVVAVIAVYTIAWFYAARLLEDEAAGVIGRLNQGERQLSCSQPQGKGYPFRIGLFCDAVGLQLPDRGVAISAGAFRSAAQVYAPRHIVGELDGPLVMELAGLPPIQAGWSTLRASVRIAEPIPERLSLEVSDLIVAGRDNLLDMVRARAGQFHMRPNAGNLDVAVQLSGLTVDPSLIGERRIPPLDVDLTGGMAALLANRDSLRGRSAIIRRLSLAAGENASISMAGPVSVGDDGLIDAELSISVNDPAEIARIVGLILPEAEQQIASVASGLAALGNTAAIPIRIQDGRIFLGFIPTGRIAPLE